MKQFVSAIFLAVTALGMGATVSLSNPAHAFQSGSETFPGNGSTMGGKEVATITVNYDNNTITWRYTDGTSFTQWVQPEFLIGFANHLREQQNVGEN